MVVANVKVISQIQVKLATIGGLSMIMETTLQCTFTSLLTVEQVLDTIVVAKDSPSDS